MDGEKRKTPGFMLLQGEKPVRVPRGAREISVFTGPEGGFTGAEKEAALKAGLTAASVAGNTLRSETASIAAAAVLTSAADNI